MLYLHYFFFTLCGISLFVMVLYVPLYAYKFFSRIRDFSNPAIDTASIFMKENKVFLLAPIVGLLSASVGKALEQGMNGQSVLDWDIAMNIVGAGIFFWFYYWCYAKKAK